MRENSFTNLREYIQSQKEKTLIFLCIGNAQIIGDSFGPLVGTNLQYLLKENDKSIVIGDIQNNITISNLKDKLEIIENEPKKCIIVIDSAISKTIELGNIVVTNQKTKIGQAYYNTNNMIGDISIKGIVTNSCENKNTLKNVPSYILYSLVERTTKELYEIVKNR